MLNKRMLTVEDANSIIKHFGKGFIDYFTIDTRKIDVDYGAVDFVDIIKGDNRITFKVHNSLWTGRYFIKATDAQIINLWMEDDEIIIIAREGTITYAVIELEISPDIERTATGSLVYNIYYDSVICPAGGSRTIEVLIKNGSVPATDLEVYDCETGETINTDSEGKIYLNTPFRAKGVYNYDIKINEDKYSLVYEVIPLQLPVLFESGLYSAKKCEMSCKFLFDDEYRFSEDLTKLFFYHNQYHMKLKLGGKYYTPIRTVDTACQFNVDIPDTKNVTGELIIAGNGYIDRYSVPFSLDIDYKHYNSISSLYNDLIGEYPPAILIYDGTAFDEGITVDSDLKIIFNDVVASEEDTVFTVDGAKLTLENINFTGKNLINLIDGEVVLKDCNFNHCTATVVKGKGNIVLDNCSFVDNNACIDVEGDVKATNTLFDLSDTDYLDDGKVPFLDVYGNLNIDYCTFELDLAGLDHLGYSYVICKLGEDFTTNGVENRVLFENEKFPTRNNKCSINVENLEYHITSKSSNCMTWNMINTNTVYSKSLKVDKNV